MIVGHLRSVEAEPIHGGDPKDAHIQWLLAGKEGVPHFYMRYVTVKPGATIPLHAHAPIHQMFIVKGRGALLHEGGEAPLEEGSFVYMPSERRHGLRNTGSGNLELVCCIDRPAGD